MNARADRVSAVPERLLQSGQRSIEHRRIASSRFTTRARGTVFLRDPATVGLRWHGRGADDGELGAPCREGGTEVYDGHRQTDGMRPSDRRRHQAEREYGTTVGVDA